MDWQITADRPVYLQLIEQLELAIAAGEYSAAARLPAVRELAAQAAVNPNTMQRALQELEARGLLVTQRTAGRSVTEDAGKIAALRRRLAGAEAARFLQRMGRLGCPPGEALAFLEQVVGQEAGPGGPKALQNPAQNEKHTPAPAPAQNAQTRESGQSQNENAGAPANPGGAADEPAQNAPKEG